MSELLPTANTDASQIQPIPLLALRANGIVSLFLSATLLCSGGCRSETRPEVYSVQGLVTANGEPAAQASLAFHPLAGSVNRRCPVGRTDDQGIFRLTTCSESDGAPPGEYAVTIVWLDDSIEFDECECPDPLMHDRLRGMYASAEQTELRVTVHPKANNFRFDTWRPQANDRR